MIGGYKTLKPPLCPISSVGRLTDPEYENESHPPVLKNIIPTFQEKEAVKYGSTIKELLSKPKESCLTLFDKEFVEPTRKQIKSGIPLLNHREIRRLRKPFYESILQDLKEDNYHDAEKYIRYLIDLDDSQKVAAGPHNIMIYRPHLKYTNDALKILAEGFKKGDITKDASILMKVALEFIKDDTHDWYWLAEDILRHAVEVANAIESNEKLQAISLHVQAEFLLEKLGKVYEAELQLIKSMNLSSGRIWTTKEIYGIETDILYLDSCYLLHKAYLIQAKESDVRKRIELCEKAKKLVFKTKHTSAKENAMLELINAYIIADEDKLAHHYVQKYLSYCRETNNTEGLCKAMLQLSQILLKQQNIEEGKKTLSKVIEHATIGNHKYLCAVAHQRLVLLNLKEENMTEARNNAALAYQIYTALNATQELEEMRCFFGITLGTYVHRLNLALPK